MNFATKKKKRNNEYIAKIYFSIKGSFRPFVRFSFLFFSSFYINIFINNGNHRRDVRNCQQVTKFVEQRVGDKQIMFSGGVCRDVPDSGTCKTPQMRRDRNEGLPTTVTVTRSQLKHRAKYNKELL